MLEEDQEPEDIIKNMFIELNLVEYLKIGFGQENGTTTLELLKIMSLF